MKLLHAPYHFAILNDFILGAAVIGASIGALLMSLAAVVAVLY